MQKRKRVTYGALKLQSYCYVIQLGNGRIIRGTAYLDTELVRSIW